MRQQGAMPLAVTPFIPANFTRNKPCAAPNKALSPLSVRCQHQDRSISRRLGSDEAARESAAPSAKCSHSATFSSRHGCPTPISSPLPTQPPVCTASTPTLTPQSTGCARPPSAHVERWVAKKAAQSASVGCVAFRRVRDSMCRSSARPCSTGASNSRAKDTVNLRRPTKVLEISASCSVSRSSPSKLSSWRPAHAPGVETRNICATFRRKQPSSCSAFQPPGLLENTAMFVRASQKRTSSRFSAGHRLHSCSTC
mmetsp:Transcript_115694/g.323554  ORF Transcript_115694/g.323554 Transcript_115694/m.323554 type:complete len:255 (+) Transcript_115694:380-1144(+)